MQMDGAEGVGGRIEEAASDLSTLNSEQLPVSQKKKKKESEQLPFSCTIVHLPCSLHENLVLNHLAGRITTSNAHGKFWLTFCIVQLASRFQLTVLVTLLSFLFALDVTCSASWFLRILLQAPKAVPSSSPKLAPMRYLRQDGHCSFPQQRRHPASETQNPLSPAPFSTPSLSYIPSVLTCNQTTRGSGHIIWYNRKLHAGDPPRAARSSSPIAVRTTRAPGLLLRSFPIGMGQLLGTAN
jgi:hypothetical protein